jgi:hypothetical protein
MSEQSTIKPSSEDANGPPARSHVSNKITLNLSDHMRDVLNELLKRTEDKPDDMFRKALALYKLAIEAHDQGKSVGIATSPDALETEFVGL